MVLMVACKGYGGLVVAEHNGCLLEGAEDFQEKTTQPECFLHSMYCCNILTLRCRQEDDLLLLEQPQHSAAVNKEA